MLAALCVSCPSSTWLCSVYCNVFILVGITRSGRILLLLMLVLSKVWDLHNTPVTQQGREREVQRKRRTKNRHWLNREKERGSSLRLGGALSPSSSSSRPASCDRMKWGIVTWRQHDTKLLSSPVMAGLVDSQMSGRGRTGAFVCRCASVVDEPDALMHKHTTASCPTAIIVHWRELYVRFGWCVGIQIWRWTKWNWQQCMSLKVTLPSCSLHAPLFVCGSSSRSFFISSFILVSPFIASSVSSIQHLLCPFFSRSSGSLPLLLFYSIYFLCLSPPFYVSVPSSVISVMSFHAYLPWTSCSAMGAKCQRE